MTIVLNDPSLWPLIDNSRVGSYFTAACLTVVAYDWALTFGQEFKLVWRHRWSFMTFLYLSVRYIGITYPVLIMLRYLPSFSQTDEVRVSDIISYLVGISNDRTSCIIFYLIESWTAIIVDAMLGVIMISRLYAMYQQSRQVLILLIATFLPVQIARGVICMLLSVGYASGEEYVLSGAHMCGYSFQDDIQQLIGITWVLTTAWEILALCLALRVAVKHFRELQGPSTRLTVGDCYTILVKTHLFYFASFVVVSSIRLSEFSPKIDSNSVAATIFSGIQLFFETVEMFILGPRLILGVREYHATLVTNSYEGTAMASIAFQERVQISTGSGV